MGSVDMIESNVKKEIGKSLICELNTREDVYPEALAIERVIGICATEKVNSDKKLLDFVMKTIANSSIISVTEISNESEESDNYITQYVDGMRAYKVVYNIKTEDIFKTTKIDTSLIVGVIPVNEI